MQVKIEPSWKEVLQDEFSKAYFEKLTAFVREEYMKGAVYPAPKNIFRAFDLCPFGQVEVVILGQDPYHGPGQANGLCFAVGEEVPLPPSLKNMFKEIEAELGKPKTCGTPHPASPQKGEGFIHRSGDLSRWASQGVLLLNATLTVRAHLAASHSGHGWEQFTDAVIAALSREREHLVFMLWGNYAKQKGAHIDRSKHLVLESAHPSPLSAHNGFFGNGHFKKTNEYLVAHGKKEIDWLS